MSTACNNSEVAFTFFTSAEGIVSKAAGTLVDSRQLFHSSRSPHKPHGQETTALMNKKGQFLLGVLLMLLIAHPWDLSTLEVQEKHLGVKGHS